MTYWPPDLETRDLLKNEQTYIPADSPRIDTQPTQEDEKVSGFLHRSRHLEVSNF